MKVTLTAEDVRLAIISHLNNIGIRATSENCELDIKTTRKPKGITIEANIDTANAPPIEDHPVSITEVVCGTDSRIDLPWEALKDTSKVENAIEPKNVFGKKQSA